MHFTQLFTNCSLNTEYEVKHIELALLRKKRTAVNQPTMHNGIWF